MIFFFNLLIIFNLFKLPGSFRPRPADTRRLYDAVLMLAHRLRRWPNINAALYRCLLSDLVFQINLTPHQRLRFNPLTAGAAFIRVFIFY